jgi:hypothetical protein
MPVNTPHNDRSVPVPNAPVENRVHLIPRRPVTSATTGAQSSQPGPNPPYPPQSNPSSVSNDPAIRTLSTSFTFPGGRASSVSGPGSLQIPRFQTQAHTASAPVTPVSHHRGADVPLHQPQAPPFPVPRPAIQTAVQSTTSSTSPLPPSTQHHSPSVNRRVASTEFMRSMPPPLANNANRLSRHSTEWTLEPTQSHPIISENRPVVSRLSTVMTSQSLEPQPPTPSSRRQWWRVGHTPTRSQPPVGTALFSSGPIPHSRSNTPFGTPSEDKSSKCVIQ